MKATLRTRAWGVKADRRRARWNGDLGKHALPFPTTEIGVMLFWIRLWALG